MHKYSQQRYTKFINAMSINYHLRTWKRRKVKTQARVKEGNTKEKTARMRLQDAGRKHGATQQSKVKNRAAARSNVWKKAKKKLTT